MNRQVIIGFTTEGTTDLRFLESVIRRTFEEVAFECKGQIEILPVQHIEKKNGHFVEVVKDYAIHAEDLGVMVLCIHNDADARDDAHVFHHKINPAFNAVESDPEIVCKNLVAVVPVQMTEAWMLADIMLLKEEIGTAEPDIDLGLHRPPETIANPKQTIEEAIRIARENMTKRRRHALTIGELYQPIGQKIQLNRLQQLPSF